MMHGWRCPGVASLLAEVMVGLLELEDSALDGHLDTGMARLSLLGDHTREPHGQPDPASGRSGSSRDNAAATGPVTW